MRGSKLASGGGLLRFAKKGVPITLLLLVCGFCLGDQKDPRSEKFEQYRLDPLPAELLKMKGVHPRILLTGERVLELRKAIETTHADLWKRYRPLAESTLKLTVPKYKKSDRLQQWQRSVGFVMPYPALAYVITQDKKYLDETREWALAACGYPTWGLNDLDGLGLGAAQQLIGLAIVYDWCWDDLNAEDRKTIRDTIIQRGSGLFRAMVLEKRPTKHSGYMGGQLWLRACSLAFAGIAVFDEFEDASKWIGLAMKKFDRTMKALGPDGVDCAGLSYWSSGITSLLLFYDVAAKYLDVDYRKHPWVQSTSYYLQYLTLPSDSWSVDNSIVDFGDCHQRKVYHGPDHALTGLARMCQNGHAQWLAQKVQERKIGRSTYEWLNLVWYDPSVSPVPQKELPLLRHFEDYGIVSTRSDWSGRESLLVFKCGPFIGHNAIQQFDQDPGSGHAHPDANHFALFGAGEWLIRNDGYAPKFTGQHNTLLVNGRGQLGEGGDWYASAEPLKLKPRPKIILSRPGKEFDHIAGDATKAYPPKCGLNKYVRHLLFVKPDVLIVLDEIGMDRKAQLEIRFHPETSSAQQEAGAFYMQGKKAVLKLESLTPEDVVASAENTPDGKSPSREMKMFTIRLRTERANWRNAVALSWAESREKLKDVNLKKRGDVWEFTVSGKRIAFNWKTKIAKLLE